MLLTDPGGNRLGLNFVTGEPLVEIQNAYHDLEGPYLSADAEQLPGENEKARRCLNIAEPLAGHYSLEVKAVSEDAVGTPLEVHLFGEGGGTKVLQIAGPSALNVVETRIIEVPAVPAKTSLALTAQANLVSYVGDTVVIGYTLTNSGASAASDIEFSAVVPEGVSLLATNSTAGACSSGSRVAGCTIEVLPAGGTATLTLTARLNRVCDVVIPANVFSFAGDENATDNKVETTITARARYASWQKLHFTAEEIAVPAMSGPEANPDGDGMPNLLEYALNRDPRKADAAFGYSGISLQILPFLPYSLSFEKMAAAEDLSVIVEFSDNLTTWSEISGAEMRQFWTAPDKEMRSFTLSSEPSDQSRLFFRLKATLSP